MEVVVAQAVGGELVDIVGFDQATEAAKLGKTDIIEQKNDDIGRTFFGTNFFRPPFLRILIFLRNLALELPAFSYRVNGLVYDRSLPCWL